MVIILREFYLEPHGLIYVLKTLPGNTLLPPPADKDLIAENEAFWADAQTQVLASVEDAIAPPASGIPETFAEGALARLHVPQEPGINATTIGLYCSRSLDFWGVELQRTGDLTKLPRPSGRLLCLIPITWLRRLISILTGLFAKGSVPSWTHHCYS